MPSMLYPDPKTNIIFFSIWYDNLCSLKLNLIARTLRRQCCQQLLFVPSTMYFLLLVQTLQMSVMQYCLMACLLNSHFTTLKTFSIGFKLPLHLGIGNNLPSTSFKAFLAFAQFKIGQLSCTNSFEPRFPLDSLL